MTARLHLPHPHIADRMAEVFAHALHERLHHTTPIVPDGHDWDEWHYADARPDWEADR